MPSDGTHLPATASLVWRRAQRMRGAHTVRILNGLASHPFVCSLTSPRCRRRIFTEPLTGRDRCDKDYYAEPPAGNLTTARPGLKRTLAASTRESAVACGEALPC
jgi:hypothetical protein